VKRGQSLPVTNMDKIKLPAAIGGGHVAVVLGVDLPSGRGNEKTYSF